MSRKTNKKIIKAAKETVFYIFLTTLIAGMLLPVYFIFSLSFLSTREAYRYPLPLVPALTTKLELTNSERGYLLSVWDRIDNEYQTVLDTGELFHRRFIVGELEDTAQQNRNIVASNTGTGANLRHHPMRAIAVRTGKIEMEFKFGHAATVSLITIFP
jgi:ABC-type glycerol-3-phosphate transport system permease component